MPDPKPGKPIRQFKPFKSTWIFGAIVLWILIISLASGGLPGLLIFGGIIGFITALYVIITGRRSWALIQSRKFAAITLAVCMVAFIAGGAVAGVSGARNQELAASNATITPKPAHTQSPKPTLSPVAFTEGDPGDPITVVASDGQPTVAITDNTVTDSLASNLLATLPIKGKAPKTGYDRTADFGTAWLDVDHNGCDTRNDILSRDLTNEVMSGTCKVLSGTLAEPYTGMTIAFLRGNITSSLVQIDHMVALSNAWQTGAQQLTQTQRISLANDPMNLMAVDGRANAQKGDGDAATWLPPVKSFRCTYVARQISVKATYALWVTQAEHDAMARILSDCSGQRAMTSTFAPAPAPLPVVVEPPAPAPVAPAPAPAPKPAPAPAPAPAGAVHPGAFCSGSGSTGVTTTGKPMVCRTSPTDTRLRWRAP